MGHNNKDNLISDVLEQVSTGAGESAYQVAVRNGFTGTEQEWLLSLKGERGETGQQGEAGSTGQQGERGSDGATGSQGEQGLKGDTGSQGIPGQDSTVPGPKGDKGDTGDQGVQGLKGDKGDPGSAYTLTVQALTSSPTDSQTVYFGQLPKAPTTTANISKVYIRKAGTIKIANIYCYSGTAGTNEVWSLYIRKNNSADTLIATLSQATNERIFVNEALNIPVAVGDYIEIKGVQPLWATNPLTCIYGGYLYIE
jgi:hypothetical protein